MSEIDEFQHDCIGFIRCPSAYELVFQNRVVKEIPIYRLNESAQQWKAKAGDLIVGGGRGEAAALRVAIPEAVFFFTHSEWDCFESHAEIFQAFWSPNQSFIFCDGYRKLGWLVSQPIEAWIAEHLVAFLMNAYQERYGTFLGTHLIELDGSICRIPTSS